MAGLPTTAGAAVLATTAMTNPVGWGLIAGEP